MNCLQTQWDKSRRPDEPPPKFRRTMQSASGVVSSRPVSSTGVTMDARAQSFSVNGVRVDFGAETVRDSNDDPVALRPQSFAVLRQLVLSGGQLVTKQELLSAVWSGIAVTDDSL